MPSKWPKHIPDLTPEQKVISNDFMKFWSETLANNYGVADRFNQSYAVKHAPKSFVRTLEIGAGLGEHLLYEKLTPEQEANYYAMELRPNMSAEIARRFPKIHTVTGDCQTTMPFADGFFDRVLAIHVLEHLPNLPAAVAEAHRLCHPETGVFSVVIPCEGSLAYSIARKISAQRVFEKRYKQSYRWFIEREHINLPDEILEVLTERFTISHRTCFPFPVPLQWCNLFIGLTLKPKRMAATMRRAA